VLGGVCGNIVDVFAVNVQGFADECAAAVATAGVTLFETEELDFRLDEVEELHFCEIGDCQKIVESGLQLCPCPP